ncbi:MAG: putative selenate reductase subunit YgfK, partial [Oscillospiraceae bacterium]
LDARGRAVVNPETLESSIGGVYVAGDANRGPATVVEAIADAAKVAAAIAGAKFERFAACNSEADCAAARAKKGVLRADCGEPERCLACASVCELCVDVCPNRANVSVMVNGRPQIVHLDGLCNECGNCATFCPYDSAPYRDKFTLFWSKADFESSKNEGFLPLENGRVLVRLDGAIEQEALNQNALPDELAALMRAVCGEYSHLLLRTAEV